MCECECETCTKRFFALKYVFRQMVRHLYTLDALDYQHVNHLMDVLDQVHAPSDTPVNGHRGLNGKRPRRRKIDS